MCDICVDINYVIFPILISLAYPNFCSYDTILDDIHKAHEVPVHIDIPIIYAYVDCFVS